VAVPGDELNAPQSEFKKSLYAASSPSAQTNVDAQSELQPSPSNVQPPPQVGDEPVAIEVAGDIFDAFQSEDSSGLL